jgi:hypothetical protein
VMVKLEGAVDGLILKVKMEFSQRTPRYGHVVINFPVDLSKKLKVLPGHLVKPSNGKHS